MAALSVARPFQGHHIRSTEQAKVVEVAEQAQVEATGVVVNGLRGEAGGVGVD